MVKSSGELIKKAKHALKCMLERSIEKDEQPSFLEMYYRGYCDGACDNGGGVTVDNEWHYVKLEGVPETDDKCWCLIQADGYYATEMGWYDKDDDKWNCEYWCGSYEKVVAWHMLPREPKWEGKACQ